MKGRNANHMKLSKRIRFGLCASWCMAAMAGSSAHAEVNLEWRPAAQAARVNDIVEIELYAVYTGSGNANMTSMDVLPNWDPTRLELLGALNNGPYTWLMAGGTFFPSDAGLDGLNNTWTDGNAKFTALAQFTMPAQATMTGLKVATFRFRALAPTAATNLTIAPTMGQFSRTVVYGNAFPGQETTGTLGSAQVSVCAAAPSGDMDGNGIVDGDDIDDFVRAALSGSTLAADVCPGDFDGNRAVGAGDVAGMVAALLSP